MDDVLGIGAFVAACGLVGIFFLSLFCEILPESGWECTEYVTASADEGRGPKPYQTCVEYRRVGTTRKPQEAPRSVEQE